MGTEATQWQMFQQISLYNKKLGQNCRKGCFLKKHTDFKEMSGGICNIYRAVPAEEAGLQARGRSGQAMMGACSRGREQHLGCSKLARTVWKSSCGASNFDFTELRRGLWGEDTGCTQELMCFGSRAFSPVIAEGHIQLQNRTDTPGQSCSIHRAVSVGLGQDPSRQLLQGVLDKEYPDKSVKTPHTLSWQEIPKGYSSISI